MPESCIQPHAQLTWTPTTWQAKGGVEMPYANKGGGGWASGDGGMKTIQIETEQTGLLPVSAGGSRGSFVGRAAES